MPIALFIDVDKTLTRKPIQEEFALALGCETQYYELERKYQAEAISSGEFGTQIIRLFASKGFRRDQANEISNRIELQEWTPRILEMKGVEVFLVSSGPSYYIDHFAQKYNIPEGRVLRSQYKFARDTGIIESCDAITAMDKAVFVKKKSSNYKLK